MPVPSPPLQGWTLVSLRPRGQHAALRAAATRAGAATLALAPLAIEPIDDAATRRALAAALDCDVVLFTSPNAVRSAFALQAFTPAGHQRVLAVGEGTRLALGRAGLPALAPRRMDTEGLLAMPVLQGIALRRAGLVTGMGGRNRLAPALRARGAEVLRADVYARVPVAIAAARWRTLGDALASPGRVLLALSSDEALQAALAQLPPPLHGPLRRVAVVAASERLAQSARSAGFERVAIAASARPADLLRAACDAFV